MNEKACAEAILRFVTETACPYGSGNLDEGNKAREKVLAIRAGSDKGLDWRNLDAKDAMPWNSNELKGIKTAIASDLKSGEHPEEHKFAVRSFNDVKKIAERSIQYGTGRCAGLAAVALIRARELAPHIPILVVHFFKEEKNQDAHALLLVGVNLTGSSGTPTMSTYFCDLWKKKVGSITEYPQYIQSLGYSLKNCIVSAQWLPDDSISPEACVTPKWLAERQQTLSKIEAIYQAFIAKNNELKYVPVFNQSVVLLGALTKYKTFGFWQSREDYVVGARISCETKENKEALALKFKTLGISFKADEDCLDTNLIVNGINGRDNATKIDIAYRKM